MLKNTKKVKFLVFYSLTRFFCSIFAENFKINRNYGINKRCICKETA